jgi:phosphoribosylamine--glycine ligase
VKFHFLSEEASSLFLAWRLKHDGHAVTFYHLDDPTRKARVGDGMVKLSPTPEPPKGAIVIFDSTGKGRMGTDLRRRGWKVIGGNPFDEDLELDRASGTKIMQALGIATPKTKVMGSISQGQAYVSTHPGVWYFKPNGKTTTLTNHGEGKMFVRWLEWASQFIEGEPFELQAAVEGIEISTEGWFDGQRFVPPFNSTLEEKHFLTGDHGPRTGCESNVVWCWEGNEPQLPKGTVLRLTALLKKAGYVGPVDLNAIIDGTGKPHGLEWSARLGFDASQAYSLLVDGDYGEQLAAFAEGKLDRWDLKPGYAMTLRVTVPPYPSESVVEAKKTAGLPIDPAIVADPRRYLPSDVRIERGGPVVAGAHGYVVAVGTTGSTFSACRKTLLRMADDLDLEQKQYRVDPVHRAEKAWAALEAHGLVELQKAAA